jgi:hypothetical protein
MSKLNPKSGHVKGKTKGSFSKCIRPQVRLRNGESCSLKKHFVSKSDLSQFVGYADYLANKNPRRFAYASLADFARHMVTSKQSNDPPTDRHAYRVKRFVRAVGIISDQFDLYIDSAMHEGFTVIAHDELCERQGNICRIRDCYNLSCSNAPMSGADAPMSGSMSGVMSGVSPKNVRVDVRVDVRGDALEPTVTELDIESVPVSSHAVCNVVDIASHLTIQPSTAEPLSLRESFAADVRPSQEKAEPKPLPDFTCRHCNQTVSAKDFIAEVHMCPQRTADLQRDRELQGRRKRGMR